MVPLQEETNSEFSNPDSNNFGSISMTITIFIASLISDIKKFRAQKNLFSHYQKSSIFIKKCMDRIILME